MNLVQLWFDWPAVLLRTLFVTREKVDLAERHIWGPAGGAYGTFAVSTVILLLLAALGIGGS